MQYRLDFGKVVFIISKENEADFRESIGNRMEKRIPVEYVFQDLHNLPEGFEVPEGRIKPWEPDMLFCPVCRLWTDLLR